MSAPATHHSSDSALPPLPRARRSAELVGTRAALVGVLLYLCEFVGIGLSHAGHLPFVPGTPSHGVASAYDGHAGGLGFLVGWYGITELGRVLFVVAVAIALVRSARASTAAWFAVAAMAIGSAMEIASEALAAGAGELAGRSDAGGAVVLDRGASYLAAGLLAPTGVAVLAASIAMWLSGVFPRLMAVVGILAGVGVIGAGLASEPSQAGLQDSLTTAVMVMWVWMLWAGVLLWRRTPTRIVAQPTEQH